MILKWTFFGSFSKEKKAVCGCDFILIRQRTEVWGKYFSFSVLRSKEITTTSSFSWIIFRRERFRQNSAFNCAMWRFSQQTHFASQVCKVIMCFALKTANKYILKRFVDLVAKLFTFHPFHDSKFVDHRKLIFQAKGLTRCWTMVKAFLMACTWRHLTFNDG